MAAQNPYVGQRPTSAPATQASPVPAGLPPLPPKWSAPLTMAPELDVCVIGLPAPQGSKRHVGNGVMVESSARVKPWRQDVREAALSAGVKIAGPVCVDLSFVMPRPKAARPDQMADKRPDLDKLVRAVLDALDSAGTFEDDSRVVELTARKRLSLGPGDPTGVLIKVRSAT